NHQQMSLFLNFLTYFLFLLRGSLLLYKQCGSRPVKCLFMFRLSSCLNFLLILILFVILNFFLIRLVTVTLIVFLTVFSFAIQFIESFCQMIHFRHFLDDWAIFFKKRTA